MSEEDSSSYQIFEVQCNPALNFKYKLKPQAVTESQETVKVSVEPVVHEEDDQDDLVKSIVQKYKFANHEK